MVRYLCEYGFETGIGFRTLTSTEALPVEGIATVALAIGENAGNLITLRLLAETRVPLAVVARDTERLIQILHDSDVFGAVRNLNTSVWIRPRTHPEPHELPELPETSVIPNPQPRSVPVL